MAGERDRGALGEAPDGGGVQNLQHAD
jgi:hypothetical protein